MNAAVHEEVVYYSWNLHHLTFVWKAVHIVCLSQQIFCTFRKSSLDIQIKWDCFELRISIDALFYVFLNLWLYGIWNGLPHSLKFWSRLIFDPFYFGTLYFWNTLCNSPALILVHPSLKLLFRVLFLWRIFWEGFLFLFWSTPNDKKYWTPLIFVHPCTKIKGWPRNY